MTSLVATSVPTSLEEKFQACQGRIHEAQRQRDPNPDLAKHELNRAWAEMYALLQPIFPLSAIDYIQKVIAAQNRLSRKMNDPVLREIGCTDLLAMIPASHIQPLADAFGFDGQYKESVELTRILGHIWSLACIANRDRRERRRVRQIQEARYTDHRQLIEDIPDLEPTMRVELKVFGIFTANELAAWSPGQLATYIGKPVDEAANALNLLRGIGITPKA